MSINLLVGLAGGIALTSLSAARRTDSSYPGFLRSTNPSGLLVQPSTELSIAGADAFRAEIARLPHVRSVESSFALNAATLTLGFTRRRLLATVAWQATTIAVVGIAIGLPLAIALGRWLWVLFAHDSSAVPHPTVSATAMAAVVGGALLLANAAAAVPARQAARTSTSWLLRAD